MNVLIAIVMALLQFFPFFGSGNAQETGRALAEQVTYTIYTVPDSQQQSVLITIPLEQEQYLQLYSPHVLRAFTAAALELQAAAIPEGTEDVSFLLMDAAHIAGETRLHLIGYVFTHLVGGAQGPLAGYYDQFRVISLNVDEARVPHVLIELAGWLTACLL